MNIEFIETPTQKEIEFIEDKLMAFNETMAGEYSYNHFIYKVVDDSDQIYAGIHCTVSGGWLYIAGLWIAEQHRGKGLGKKLLDKAEQKAMEIGCHSSYLFTYDFQAPDFYLKTGYQVFSRLDEYFGTHSKLFMKKQLRLKNGS